MKKTIIILSLGFSSVALSLSSVSALAGEVDGKNDVTSVYEHTHGTGENAYTHSHGHSHKPCPACEKVVAVKKPSIVVAVKKPSVFTFRGLFPTNGSNLKNASKVQLDDYVEYLNKVPSASVRVEGHTDFRASASYNKALSQRRADSVKRYLISQGISSTRVEAIGMGEDYPVASNKTKLGMAENRRVTIEILD